MYVPDDGGDKVTELVFVLRVIFWNVVVGVDSKSILDKFFPSPIRICHIHCSIWLCIMVKVYLCNHVGRLCIPDRLL